MDAKKKSDSVRRLKRIIVMSVIIIILIPSVMCIFLFSRVNDLERQVDDLFEAKLEQEVEMSMMFDAYGNSGEDYIVSETIAEPEKTDSEVENQTIAQEMETTEESEKGKQGVPEKNTRKVYLTFDDGPSSHTNEILDILSAYDVKATFFVVAKTEEEWKPVYQRIVNEGHTLAMHSYTHKYGEIYESMEAFSEDVTKLQNFLYDVTGQKCMFYRFPGGSSNTVSRVPMDTMIEYLNSQGITYFDWNVTAKDATGGYVSADMIVENCIEGVKKQDTSVVLLHDAVGKETTVEALPLLIEEILVMENTEILPITAETSLVQHR